MEGYLIIFFVYSFCGWFLESVGGILNVKKFVNRGFLIGPYCPVYGIGVLLITICLYKYMNDLVILYFMSVLICGVLEYLTSYIMEKIFKARWWDYHNMKFNINGRICLETLLPFGFVGLVLVKFVNPLIFSYIRKIPNLLLLIILFILTIIFVIDVIISFSVIFKFRKNVKNVQREIKDNTDEIVQKVKEETEKRIIEAKEDIGKLKRKISLSLDRIKENVVYKSGELQVLIQKWKEKQKNRRKNIEDLTRLVKEKYFKRNIFSNRLFKAFPKLEVENKKDKNKRR